MSKPKSSKRPAQTPESRIADLERQIVDLKRRIAELEYERWPKPVRPPIPWPTKPPVQPDDEGPWYPKTPNPWVPEPRPYYGDPLYPPPSYPHFTCYRGPGT